MLLSHDICAALGAIAGVRCAFCTGVTNADDTRCSGTFTGLADIVRVQ